MATIQHQAQQQINPIIAALTRTVNRRTRLAQKAISGYTRSYANQLGQINVGAPYGAAEAGQAAVDSALQQSLQGAGTDLASQLASRLAALQGSSGQQAVAQEGGTLASRGQSAGNTTAAYGSASLGNLIANQADAGAYSRKLPGLAKLSGLQGIKQAQQQGLSAISEGTLAAEQQLPSIISSIRQFRQNQQQFQENRREFNVSAGQRQQEIDISRQNSIQQAINDNRNYKLALMQLGIDKRKAQAAAFKAQVEFNNGGFTPTQIAHFKSDAASIADDAFNGVPAYVDDKGHRHDALAPLNYRQAMKEMTKGIDNGTIPPTIAMEALQEAGYEPGSRGMPRSNLQKALQAFAFNTGSIGGAGLKSVVNLAREYMGTPYLWGGTTPKGFDCSGFAQFLYKHAGIGIPRTTYDQWGAGRAVGPGELRPGDLVFFKGSDAIYRNGQLLPGHVGIYIGNGRMIDAPHTGANVRIDRIGSFGGYMGARRYGGR